jgi:hypothetical protein
MLNRIRGELGRVKRKLDDVKRKIDKISSAGIGAKANWAKAPASEQRAFFSRLTTAQQREFFDTNGFLWVPDALSQAEVAQLLIDAKSQGLKGTTEDFWRAPSFPPLIDNEKVLAGLHAALGEDLRFFKGAYTGLAPSKEAGMQPHRNTLHVDYGIGESIEDWRNSCASWVNVGFYLTDLTAHHSPFWIVPGSNRYYHLQPWTDMEYLADEAEMVLAKAGDAVLFHCMTVHANAANVSNQLRQAVFLSYRPAWARHIGTVQEWPREFIDSAPERRRKLLVGMNEGSSLPRNTL